MPPSSFDLSRHGLTPQVEHWNLPVPSLMEAAVRRGEGRLTRGGALVVLTSPHTGRSPKDKYLVREPGSRDQIWWGEVNQPLDEAHYDRLRRDVAAYLNGREVFVRDVFVCAEAAHRLRVRLISEGAWYSLFARHLFLRPPAAELVDFAPDFTVLHAPEMRAEPARHGTRSATAVVLNFAAREIVIVGTRYGGEIKKSIFTALNYLLPNRGVMPMHCSANVGHAGEPALFFGLSGTGKTTLSADSSRGLIGDDEHGWSDGGIFNFEGGCYAKVIRLSAEAEPEIHATLSRFGTVLENVVMDDDSRTLDVDSEAITENTRAAYPIDFIANHVASGTGGHPQHVIFLAADAFGVLPPIARLTPQQAMYHFLSGYTAKVAGTERGVTEPEATFSTCFGAVFMVHHPTVYAELLGGKLGEHQAAAWLVNTGWSGGPYGVGRRMPIAHTRAMVHAILDGSLAQVAAEAHPVFGVRVPLSCPNVPAEVLNPRNTWASKGDYDATARNLAARFAENFAAFRDRVPAEVADAGPKA